MDVLIIRATFDGEATTLKKITKQLSDAITKQGCNGGEIDF